MKVRAKVLAVSLTAVVLTACSSPGPAPTGTDNPTASGNSGSASDPSATTGYLGNADPRFAHRDARMTDAQALERIDHPATGESWFSSPREIDPPAWAAGDDFLGDESRHWYELGMRDGRTIVGFDDISVSELFERDASGTYEWIAFPSARAETEGAAPSYGFDAIVANTTVYYDSLSLPAQLALPTGEPLVVPERDFGTVELPGNGSDTNPPFEVVNTIGDFTILRIEEPVTFVWSDVYEVTAPKGLTYTDVYYLLETPYGMLIPLTYYPVGQLEDISWSITTTVAEDGPGTYLADLNDIGCGERDHDHNTAVTGTAEADWFPAGTTTDGDEVFVANISNPLARPMYDAYRLSRSTIDPDSPARSIGYFLNAPGLLGYESADTGEMFVYLNGAFSGRAWC